MESSRRTNVETITIPGIGANGSRIYNEREPFLSNMSRFLQRVNTSKRQETNRQLAFAFLLGTVAAALMISAMG
jgi:hypothetical protein